MGRTPIPGTRYLFCNLHVGLGFDMIIISETKGIQLSCCDGTPGTSILRHHSFHYCRRMILTFRSILDFDVHIIIGAVIRNIIRCIIRFDFNNTIAVVYRLIFTLNRAEMNIAKVSCRIVLRQSNDRIIRQRSSGRHRTHLDRI